MAQCEYCEIIGRKKNVLFADEDTVVAVKDKVMAPGQITVFPIEHYPIMEMVPDEVLKKCAEFANKVSVAIFEGQGAEGTNILVRNGLGAGQNVPHFGFDIVPRRKNDGLKLQWQGKQLREDELDALEGLFGETIAVEEAGKKEAVKAAEKSKKLGKGVEVVDDEKKKNKASYLLKSLKRMP